MSRVMINIPDEFLNEIDRAAAAEHRSRSELFREAMRHYLRGAAPRHTTSATSAAAVIERLRTQAARRASEAGDSTELLRAIRGYSDDEPMGDDDTVSR